MPGQEPGINDNFLQEPPKLWLILDRMADYDLIIRFIIIRERNYVVIHYDKSLRSCFVKVVQLEDSKN